MLWVVDDFYPNPDEIRAEALKLKYNLGRSERGVNHPGERSLTYRKDQRANEYWIRNRAYLRNRWSTICNSPAIAWESMNSNCAFNLCDKKGEARFSWIHSDDDQNDSRIRMYACVLYLTPNPPPQSGTIMFAYKGNPRDEQVERKEKNKHYPVIRGNYYLDPTSTNPDWTPHITVENIYNRCIIYEADMLHAPQDAGFGNSKETARLTQLGFWHGERR